ncbi:MAG: Hsp20/alpha crystallin family protein [Rubrobacter sp.]|nr:Hsp20/alpha crystallin family protein [Rubrobacter sp.]
MSLSPLRGFFDFQNEMSRMFDEMFRGLSRRPREVSGRRFEWSPAVDVFSRDGDLVIKAELPGVRREDVDITLQDGVLTISGERKETEEESGEGYLVRERFYGSFRRSFQLPEGVDESKIHARFEDGVLEVVVEGAAQKTQPRRIQIEGSGS